MTRKDFISQVSFGAVAALAVQCGIGCTKTSSNTVDFTIDVSSGTLASNGGFLVHNGVLVARTNSGTFIAVSAACTHEGTNVNYNAASNSFVCPNHGARFNSTGSVTKGPANMGLTNYNTTLSGNSLRVFA